jgi:hypothetical protein
MRDLTGLARSYEDRRFPPARRLDLQAEGPEMARGRALRWIESVAHEEPGVELLLILERRAGPVRTGSVRSAVEALLDDLTGRLLDWWEPFGPGSLVVRVSSSPDRFRRVAERDPRPGPAARFEEAAATGWVEPREDIPADLLPTAERIAELRRQREGLSPGLVDVMLQQIWVEVQALAMDESISFELALEEVLGREEERGYE